MKRIDEAQLRHCNHRSYSNMIIGNRFSNKLNRLDFLNSRGSDNKEIFGNVNRCTYPKYPELMLHGKNKDKDLIRLKDHLEIHEISQTYGSLPEDEINDIVHQLRELADVRMVRWNG